MGTVQKVGPFEIEINSIDDATREFFERFGAQKRAPMFDFLHLKLA